MKFVTEAPVFDPGSFDQSVLSDPILSARIREFNDRYLHWTEVRYRTADETEFNAVWSAMKFIRGLTSQRLTICDKEFSYCMTPRFTELLHYIDRDAAGRIETRLSGERETKRYLANSLMEEAIASSQIEGAATTRKVAKQMILSRRKPQTPGEIMILNNYWAMDRIKRSVDLDLTPELILDMHRTITSGTIGYGAEWEGRFRDSDDIVVGDPLDEEKIYHRPPRHELISGFIYQLCSFANNEDGAYMHPIIKAVILHYMIGYIHPFVDGNGRLARSLFYWYCLKNGYRLFEYASISTVIKKSKGQYGRAYQYSESDGDDLTYFIAFNLECIRRSVEDLTDYMDRKAEEQRSALRFIEDDPRLNITEANLMKDQTRNQDVFSIYEVQSRYNVVYETARKYVMHLRDLGYIVPAGKKGKQQLFMINPDRPSVVSKGSERWNY